MHESARIVFLVRRLRIAVADMTIGCRHIGIRRGRNREFVAARNGKLEFRDRRQAIALANAGGGGQRLGQGGIEFRFDQASGEDEVQPWRGREADLRLHTGFVVQQTFVVIALEGAEQRLVVRRAQRHVERIVHSAEAEAFRCLRVQRERVVDVVTKQLASAHAVGLRSVRRIAAIGEQAARDEAAAFFEIVITRADGHIESVGEGVCRFAENGDLLQFVGDIGIVGRIEVRKAIGDRRRGSRAQRSIGRAA